MQAKQLIVFNNNNNILAGEDGPGNLIKSHPMDPTIFVVRQ